jgi:hypothetical protein
MRFALLVALLCAFASLTEGQGLPIKPAPRSASSLELQTEIFQDRYLPGESIEVEFRLRNLSGEPLTFRPEDEWLDVTMRRIGNNAQESSLVPRIGPVRINEVFTVPHTVAVKARLDITSGFGILPPGRYKLDATMLHPATRAPSRATSLLLEVVPGSKIWEQEFGFRGGGAEAQPELRKYSLQKMTTKSEVRLYIGVTDATEQTVFRQVALGRAANSDNPQARIDRMSYLHVVHQTGPRTFTHTVVNPVGDTLRRMTYDAVSGGLRPLLKSDEEGRVSLVGGMRRPQSNDIPAAEPPLKPAESPALPQ